MQSQNPTDRLVRDFPNLSPQLQRAARFVMDHPIEVATRSMRDLAREAGVPHATMSRLAVETGHETFAKMKARYREEIASNPESFAGRAWHLQKEASSDLNTAVRLSQSAALEGLHRSTGKAIIDAATKRLLLSKKVTVAGLMSSFAFAHYFHYTARMMFDHWRLGGAGRSGLADEISELGTKDTLVAIALHPYARETVDAARVAKRQGASLIAMTDQRTSPIASIADILILVPTEGPQFFPSHVALTAVIEEIIASLASGAGTDALNRLGKLEETRHLLGQYTT